MDTMQQLTVLAVLSLCCTSRTSGTGDCHPEGPENCKIMPGEYSQRKSTVCSWSLESNFTFYQSNSWPYWFVGLTYNSEEGKLTSRTACSTRGQTHCLCFFYKFEQNNTIDLSVTIQFEGTDQAESPLWIMSSSDGWDNAIVPISTDRNFTVVFKAKRQPPYISSSDSVFIDVISYSKSRCQFGLYPANAQPTMTTTSTTTNIFSTTAASSTKVTRNDIASDTTKSNHSKEEVKHTVTTTVGTRSTTPSPPQTDSEMPLGTVGVIVGAVVAVVVFFSIILVLVVVLRRKQRNSKHLRIESRHQREQPEPENDVYEIPDTPRTNNENSRETATETDQEDNRAHNPDNGVYIDLDAPTTDDNTREDYGAHKAAPIDGQREVSDGAGLESTAANYDRVDFSDAEKDIRVYGGLHVYTNTCQATPKRELYETLSEQRDNHIYSEALKRI